MYFGSVRFFKNLILLVVVVLIAVPTGMAIYFGTSLGTLQREKDVLAVSIDELSAQVDELKGQLDGISWVGSGGEHPSYQDLYPDMYVEGKPEQVYQEKTVYLTFDDGPSERTGEILDVLERYDIKATFFVVGGENETRAERLREIAAAGHTIGVHSYTHEYRDVYQSVESYLEDFYRTYTMVKNATGEAPTVFRFPGGSINNYNAALYQEIIAEMLRRGFVYFDWNVSAEDATGRGVSRDEALRNVLNSAEGKSRCIVLLHDSAGMYGTAAALPGMIEALQARGYTFDRLTRDVLPVTFGY